MNINNSNDVRDWLKANCPEILKAFKFEAWNDALNEIFNIKGNGNGPKYFGDWSVFDKSYISAFKYNVGALTRIQDGEECILWLIEKNKNNENALSKSSTSLLASAENYNIYLLPKATKENPFYD